MVEEVVRAFLPGEGRWESGRTQAVLAMCTLVPRVSVTACRTIILCFESDNSRFKLQGGILAQQVWMGLSEHEAT